MNFLAHLWLTEQAGLPPAGAVLGDLLRGPVPAALPLPLAQSVRLHRRIDVLTDAHPAVLASKAAFPPGPRRYAGILLDILFDHCLATAWNRFSKDRLDVFAARSGQAVAGEREWFERFGHKVPDPGLFSKLLVSYATEAGIERAVRRTATRLRQPEGLLKAMDGWQARVPALEQQLPVLMGDLERAAQGDLNSALSASSR